MALHHPNNGENDNDHDIDSACSTPYASAPSSPTRRPCYFFSAPASPMHYMLHSAPAPTAASDVPVSSGNFEFDFSAPSLAASADELFLNGQIRRLEPLIDAEEEDDSSEPEELRGRDLRTRSRSMHRRTRSMSPLRNRSSHNNRKDLDLAVDSDLNKADENELPPTSAEEPISTSRSSSSGRNSKRWVFIKELLYRSKSEGRGSTGSKEKFWQNLSFSPSLSSSSKDKTKLPPPPPPLPAKKQAGKRRGPAPSAHERHYTTNRAAAEEMRKRTFLPYRQGLLGCLGFGSRSYGAVNGFARAFNPVSTR